MVEPDGQVTLGPAYGRVNLKGLTFEEAENVAQHKLGEVVRQPEVSITLEGWRMDVKSWNSERAKDENQAAEMKPAAGERSETGLRETLKTRP